MRAMMNWAGDAGAVGSSALLGIGGVSWNVEEDELDEVSLGRLPEFDIGKAYGMNNLTAVADTGAAADVAVLMASANQGLNQRIEIKHI